MPKPRRIKRLPLKHPVRWALALLAVFMMLVVVGALVSSATTTPPCAESYRNDKTVKLRDATLHAQLADTTAARTQGLSGKACLSADQAMLFAFDRPGDYCFWMKNMNFPIDMVWLNEDREVTHMVSDALPSSYPHDFCPPTASTYVLELRAGSVKRLELAEGDSVRF